MLDDYVLIPEVKVITLQLLYELEYPEEALSAADSFTHFIKNNKRLNSNYKNICGNFIIIYKMLLNSKLNGKEPAYKKFTDIEESETCTEKNWLKEKFNILMKARDI